MTTSHGLLLVFMALLPVVAGCYGTTDAPDANNTPATKEYDIKGKVIAVGGDKRSVTIDHEEIPGLMKGMQMKFTVESPSALEGISAGDKVAGRLRVQGSDYTITKLQKE